METTLKQQVLEALAAEFAASLSSSAGKTYRLNGCKEELLALEGEWVGAYYRLTVEKMEELYCVFLLAGDVLMTWVRIQVI